MTEYWTLKLSMEFLRGVGTTLIAVAFLWISIEASTANIENNSAKGGQEEA